METTAKPDLTLTPWSDEYIEELAQITPERQQQAAEWWRINAPKRFKNLLDATEQEPAV